MCPHGIARKSSCETPATNRQWVWQQWDSLWTHPRLIAHSAVSGLFGTHHCVLQLLQQLMNSRIALGNSRLHLFFFFIFIFLVLVVIVTVLVVIVIVIVLVVILILILVMLFCCRFLCCTRFFSRSIHSNLLSRWLLHNRLFSVTHSESQQQPEKQSPQLLLFPLFFNHRNLGFPSTVNPQ